MPELCFGAGTLGTKGEFFEAWGERRQGARRDGWSTSAWRRGSTFSIRRTSTRTAEARGRWAEEGDALAHLKREDVLISTKATFRFGEGPNDVGSSRYHLIQALEGSLKRLGTDYIDVYHLHAFDATTPVEETLSTLDDWCSEGKVRYIACSNFSGWHLMKSLSVSERYGWSRYVGHQVYYSLVGRDYEWELMPLALDQGLGALVWSPLGWGRLTGKIRRGTADAEGEPAAVEGGRRMRAAGSGGVCVQGGRCDRRGGEGDGQDGSADCAELAAATADDFDADHRSAERGAVEGEPGRGGVEADARSRLRSWMRRARFRWRIRTGISGSLRSGIRDRSERCG